MADIRPWPFDILTRVKKVVRDELTQAAIGIEDNDTGELSLYTDSGLLLGPGASAATGLGRTICTDNYIAFGGGSFIALDADNNSVKRGSLDQDGNFVWTPSVFVTGGEIQGISYCGGYFFVTSRHFDGSTCYIARGAKGGTQWNETTFLSGAFECGAVASKPNGVTPEGEPKILYCAVGQGDGGNPDYPVLYSATSSNGLSWSTNVSGNAGGGSYVGAGKDIFVTGGYDFSTVTVPATTPPFDEEYEIGTAAAQANWSSDGSGWVAVSQPVPGGTAEISTFCDGAVFVNPVGGDDGYFIAVTVESGEEPNSVYVIKSVSGRDGGAVIGHHTGTNAGLSVIGKNIGTVVKI